MPSRTGVPEKGGADRERDVGVSIPVIDIRPHLQGGDDERQRVARQIAAACTDSGFFCITGHGVPADLVARTRQAAVDFFALPLDEKCRILRPESRVGRGYYPHADRSLAYTLGEKTPPDLQEAFAMGPPDIPDDDYYRGEIAEYFFAANRYPARPEAFRETVDCYFRALLGLCDRLMGAMALALGLEEDFFADKIDRPACGLRLIRYPAQTAAPASGQLRAGAHTDYGTLTVLRGDDVPGTLQVRLPGGGWTDLRPPADAFVCNLGDAMARWTGGRWASTLHRVANPPDGAAQRDRISLVFFHQPNYDATLGGIFDDSGDAVTLAEHFIEKIHLAAGTGKPPGTGAKR